MFSIITPCFNSEKTIRDTIESVVAQKNVNIEYIIVDGGSKDRTLEIVRSYADTIDLKIISEPDKGIYDAMNKGVRLAKGDIIGILNSDDFYVNNAVLEKIEKTIIDEVSDACYGDITYVDREDSSKQVRHWKTGKFAERNLNSGWIPPHPAFFVKKDIYERLGLFNHEFKIAADYELMLRFLKNGIRVSYINKDIVSMREGGYSAANLKQRISGWKEIYKAWEVNGWRAPWYLVPVRLLSKIHQYL